MFGTDRGQLRRVFFDSWRKQNQGESLDAMQQAICAIIEQHPEYHALLADEASLDRDFAVEDGDHNPFLHMSMHLALHEQISTDRPAGIRPLYQQLCMQQGDAHTAEHRMMECLGESIWQAQRAQRPPDENAYLDCLKKLLRKQDG